MSNIYGKNKRKGDRNEAAAIAFLFAKGYWVKKTSRTEDYHHKADILAMSPKGTIYAIQVKPATLEMTEEEKESLINYAKVRDYKPRLLVVRDYFRCNFKKIEKEA